MFKQYGGFALAIRAYWKDYGGWRDFLHSPILHVSLLIALASHLGLIEIDWRSLAIGMMPTILGFSLAAYAITFSLMGSKLHGALARAKDNLGKPLAISVNATFFHNVFIQAISLSFSVISKGPLLAWSIDKAITNPSLKDRLISIEVSAGNFAGAFFLCYAVLLLFSSGLAMFRLGRLTPSSGSVTMIANDAALPVAHEKSARETYGLRWSIIRGIAKLLRVKG